MALLYLEQGGNTELDLTTDGNTDTFDMNFLNNVGKDFQFVRTTGTGQPLITFKISNNGINWDSWDVEGFIFKDPSFMFLLSETKDTLFRLEWLSNGSTGTFTANFNVV